MTGGPPGQRWDPKAYATNARFVAELGQPVLELLAPRPGERILDLGCGDGALTQKLAALGCKVVGVDASPEQVAAARACGLDARVMDGQSLTFRGRFDAVFSNAALHWMREADRVIAGVFRALKPGGRFVAEMGGAGNVEAIAGGLREGLSLRGLDATLPWYFPGAETYRRKLEGGGFTVERIQLFPRPTPLPGDIAQWLETFAGAALARVEENQRGEFLSEMRETLRPKLQQPDGSWVADYVRLRFRAVKPL